MLRSSQMVTLLGIAVQFVGFLRTVMIAAALGVSLQVDGYNLGLVAPTFIATVIGGWLQVGFVGRYAGLVANGETELAAAYRSRMLLLVVGCAAVFSLLCLLLSYRIMDLLPTSQQALAQLAAHVLVVASWTLLPIIVADFIGLILNSHGHFFWAAFAPLLNAFVSVLSLWLWPQIDLDALVWTLLLGATAQLAFIVWALLRMKLSYTFGDALAGNEIIVTLLLALPILPATMLSNAALGIVQFRAVELGEGAVSVFGYASRLHFALSQILVMGLGTVLLPHFASLWARNDKKEIVRLIRRLVRAGFLIIAILTVGIALMGKDVVALLFGRGKFSSQQAWEVANVWVVLSLGLFPFALGTFIAKLFQAMRHAGAILFSSILSFAVVLFVTHVGARTHSIEVLVGALTASAFIVTGFWLFWLSRHFPAKPAFADLLIAPLSAAPILTAMVLAELVTEYYVQTAPALVGLFLRGVVFLSAGAAVMFALGLYRWFLAEQPADPKWLKRRYA